MSHKQDRHNCSVLINLKLFLTDLSKWRVHITGAHIPADSLMMWVPPPADKQRLDEDLRDLMISCSNLGSPKEVTNLLAGKMHSQGTSTLRTAPPTKKQISGFVSSMKKRRMTKNYDVSGEDAHQEQVFEQSEITYQQDETPVDEITVQVVESQNSSIEQYNPNMGSNQKIVLLTPSNMAGALSFSPGSQQTVRYMDGSQQIVGSQHAVNDNAQFAVQLTSQTQNSVQDITRVGVDAVDATESHKDDQTSQEMTNFNDLSALLLAACQQNQ